MKKLNTTLLVFFVLTGVFGQDKHRLMIFAAPEFSQTLKDRTKQNNIYGIGIGLQAVLVNKTSFSPIINITDDFVFSDDKVLRTDANGSEIKSIENVLKVFAGLNFNPTKSFYLSMAAGPAFINGQTLLGVQPSIGFYFPKTQRWTAKISYTNIFNRDSGEKSNYSSLNFSIGLRIW